jgi:hypothetical protein
MVWPVRRRGVGHVGDFVLGRAADPRARVIVWSADWQAVLRGLAWRP